MKKIPMRKCLATNELCPKKDLLRVVKSPEGKVFFDYSSKANGRGAYICKDSECLKKAIKSKALNRAFKMEVPDEVYEKLLSELESYEQ